MGGAHLTGTGKRARLKRWKRKEMGGKWQWIERERLKSEWGKTAAGEGRQRSSRRKLKVRVHGSIRNPVSSD